MKATDPAEPIARLNLRIDPELDHDLRLACLEHKPRLSLRDAVEEALRLWLKEDA